MGNGAGKQKVKVQHPKQTKAPQQPQQEQQLHQNQPPPPPQQQQQQQHGKGGGSSDRLKVSAPTALPALSPQDDVAQEVKPQKQNLLAKLEEADRQEREQERARAVKAIEAQLHAVEQASELARQQMLQQQKQQQQHIEPEHKSQHQHQHQLQSEEFEQHQHNIVNNNHYHHDDSDDELPPATHAPASAEQLPVVPHATSSPQRHHVPDELIGLKLLREDEMALLKRHYAQFIFNKADVNGDQLLFLDEFSSLVHSRTLNLGMSDGDAHTMFSRLCDGNNAITLREFEQALEELLGRYSQCRMAEGESAWQWFGMYFDDDPDSLPVFYNTVHNVMTYERPSVYEVREAEVQSFDEIVFVNDGRTLISYVDERGVRLYLDASGQWCIFPEDWYARVVIHTTSIGADSDDSGNASGPGDSSSGVETFEHPKTGKTYEIVWESGRRIFFDNASSSWKPLPVSVEMYIPAVASALAEIDEKLPSWKNTCEKILALREHEFNVVETIQWKQDELAIDASEGSEEGLKFDAAGYMLARERTSFSAAVRPDSEMEKTSLALQVNEAKGKISLQETRIQELEAAVKELEIAKNQPDKASQQRIAELTVELEQLREGKDTKAIIAEKDKLLEESRLSLHNLEAKLQRTEAHLHGTGSKLQYTAASLRNQLEGLRTLANEGLAQSALDMLRKVSEQVVSKFSVGIEAATKDLVAKYRYEVRQRKLLYNKLQELKGNIRVFCRVRFDDRVKCVMEFPDYDGMGTPTEIVCPNPKDLQDKKKFEFDRVYSPASTQVEVYEDTDPVITSCVDGYNVCILAYGQTGSGKTHTMMGPDHDEGVNRRAIRELMRISHSQPDIEFTMKVSLLEIYNEKIIDLLTSKSAEDQTCDIRMNPVTKQNYVEGLTERTVTSVEEVMQVLVDGNANRHIASTKMNSTSSRSHLLLQIQVSTYNKISKQKADGKLTLVDLAGSERISKTEATGQRLVEAAAINKSLTSLGQVFTALRTNQQHIPYRNSKLTHLLQDSLGGDAKCCVFVNVSPAESNLAETLGTLKFGAAIRTIELGPVKSPAAAAAAAGNTAAAPAAGGTAKGGKPAPKK